ncbi:MAG: hypothetical protein ABH883_03185 [Candidatus Omnitrophota bacterium]
MTIRLNSLDLEKIKLKAKKPGISIRPLSPGFYMRLHSEYLDELVLAIIP